MRKFLRLTIFTVTILLLNTALGEASGISNVPIASLGTGVQSGTAFAEPMERLCDILAGAKKGDLSFCLGYIRRSRDSNRDIANFILTWSPDEHRRRIPSVFRSKIDRVVTLLRTIDYQELIIDIDFIKNSQLTVGQMVKMIKGTQIRKRH